MWIRCRGEKRTRGERTRKKEKGTKEQGTREKRTRNKGFWEHGNKGTFRIAN
jgi:hypothetical protein